MARICGYILDTMLEISCLCLISLHYMPFSWTISKTIKVRDFVIQSLENFFLGTQDSHPLYRLCICNALLYCFYLEMVIDLNWFQKGSPLKFEKHWFTKLQWGISHLSEWPVTKSLQTVNVGEGVEKRECYCTVSGNANW